MRHLPFLLATLFASTMFIGCAPAAEDEGDESGNAMTADSDNERFFMGDAKKLHIQLATAVGDMKNGTMRPAGPAQCGKGERLLPDRKQNPSAVLLELVELVDAEFNPVKNNVVIERYDTGEKQKINFWVGYDKPSHPVCSKGQVEKSQVLLTCKNVWKSLTPDPHLEDCKPGYTL